MFVIYLAASVIGGAATAVLMGQHGLLIGLLMAPLGGSLFALAATLIALRRSRKPRPIPPDVVWC